MTFQGGVRGTRHVFLKLAGINRHEFVEKGTSGNPKGRADENVLPSDVGFTVIMCLYQQSVGSLCTDTRRKRSSVADVLQDLITSHHLVTSRLT
jgi:hypothetical protein